MDTRVLLLEQDKLLTKKEAVRVIRLILLLSKKSRIVLRLSTIREGQEAMSYVGVEGSKATCMLRVKESY